METSLKDDVVDLDPKSAVAGGVEDVYGEDCATEERLVTPWSITVARYNNSFTLFLVLASLFTCKLYIELIKY